MRAAARKTILRFVKETTLSRLREALAEPGAPALRLPLRTCLEAATPNLLTAGGGAKRLLLVAPSHLDASCLREVSQQASGDDATVVCGFGHEVLVCYEVERVSLEGVAARFISSRPDCQKLASRLHTRIDIDW